MITKKEDLIGCYVDGGDKELSKAFQEMLFSFGVKWLHFCDQKVRIPKDNYKYICFNGDEVSWNTRAYAEENYKRKLTLSDLKPKRTRTEYEKVTESIFDLRDEFERGGLYCKNLSGDNDYQKLNTEVALFGCAAAGNVYHRVEKVVDWRDEVSDFVIKNKITYSCNGHRHIIAMADYTDEQFLELCRVALRANGELD